MALRDAVCNPFYLGPLVKKTFTLIRLCIDNEYGSSHKSNNNNYGSSEGSSGMGMSQGNRQHESIVDKAIDGAASYAKKRW